MDRNTISLLAICPVLLATGCGKAPQSKPPSTFDSMEGSAIRAPAFAVERPDSLVSYLVWNGDSPLTVTETFGGYLVEAGDTALLGTDPFLEIETDRLNMELQFAMMTGDSVSADSLRELIEDPSVFVPVIFATDGKPELRVFPGDQIQPGDTLALITGRPPDSVFVIIPGRGHLIWPDEIEGVILPSGGLRMAGEFPGDSLSIPGFYSVASHFIHEDDLSTFLITVDSDTIFVTVTASTGSARTVYSQVPLDTLTLSGWN